MACFHRGQIGFETEVAGENGSAGSSFRAADAEGASEAVRIFRIWLQ
jgi:hypothetical protein